MALGLTNHAIKALSLKAGITNFSGLMYEETRGVIKSELEVLLRKTVSITGHNKRLRIQTDDVKRALDLLGRTPYHRNCTQVDHRYMSVAEAQAAMDSGQTRVQRHRTITVCPKKAPGHCPSPGPAPRTPETERSVEKIRHYQSQGNCMNFPREPFRRLIREIASGFKAMLQYSPEALDMIQTDMEYHIIDLLSLANLMAAHAGRKTVQPKDLQLARNARNIRRE